MRFSEFLSLFTPKSRTTKDLENDYQPVTLDDELLETHHKDCNYPKEISLMSSKEKLRCRKVKAVLRYYQSNPNKTSETYSYRLLFLFYPFRNEEESKLPPVTGSYRAELLEPGVINIINRNNTTMEPFSELVDPALLSVHSDIHFHDAFSQQENDEVYEQMSSTVDSLVDNGEDSTEDAAVLDESIYPPVYSGPLLLPDSELNSNVRKLFDVAHNWAKNISKSRSLNPHTFEKIKPLHVFLTGNAGCGKSFLMNVIYQSLTKALSYGDVVIKTPEHCLWHQQVLLLYKWMAQQYRLH